MSRALLSASRSHPIDGGLCKICRIRRISGILNLFGGASQKRSRLFPAYTSEVSAGSRRTANGYLFIGSIRDLQETYSITDHSRRGRPRSMRIPALVKTVRMRTRRNPCRKRTLLQERSYHRINDMGVPIYRGPSMCEQNIVKCGGALKKEPPRNFDAGPNQDSLASALLSKQMNKKLLDLTTYDPQQQSRHKVKVTQQWLEENVLDLIEHKDRSSSRPDLNPVCCPICLEKKTAIRAFDQVSEFDRGKIVAYRDCGLSFREIGSHIGRNQTTVMRICDRWIQEGTTDRRG
ncbi:transposable element Tcb1 transposase [Trichonephila clavipes]|nr:transposable element Tcb1 transposase [Trichonephila clavipes]